MTSISTLQLNVAADQANLQQANSALSAANANLASAVASGNTAAQAQAQNDINTAAAQVASIKTQLAADQAALDAATATSSAPANSSVAPENSQAPVTTDPQNGQTVTNYSNPSAAQLASEAAAKSTATVGSAPAGNTLPPNTLSTSSSDKTQIYKVTLSQEPKLTGDASALLTNNQVVFSVMPSISETGEASYKSFTPIQHPGEILKYDGSASRQWGITAKLVARNVAEADLNLAYINLIRSWRMPFYGTGTGAPNTQTAEFLGAPPPVLTLTAYGAQMIGPVKCVMLQYSWNWPNEVDYIHTSSGVPFPVIIDVTLSLKESYSPAEYSKFDLLQYRNGNLPAAFGGASVSQMSALGQNTPASSTTATTPTTPSNPTQVDTSQPASATIGQVNAANKNQQASVQSAAGGTSAVTSAAQSAAAQLIKKVI